MFESSLMTPRNYLQTIVLSISSAVRMRRKRIRSLIFIISALLFLLSYVAEAQNKDYPNIIERELKVTVYSTPEGHPNAPLVKQAMSKLQDELNGWARANNSSVRIREEDIDVRTRGQSTYYYYDDPCKKDGTSCNELEEFQKWVKNSGR
jgi:hypothetical protein